MICYITIKTTDEGQRLSLKLCLPQTELILLRKHLLFLKQEPQSVKLPALRFWGNVFHVCGSSTIIERIFH